MYIKAAVYAWFLSATPPKFRLLFLTFPCIEAAYFCPICQYVNCHCGWKLGHSYAICHESSHFLPLIHYKIPILTSYLSLADTLMVYTNYTHFQLKFCTQMSKILTSGRPNWAWYVESMLICPPYGPGAHAKLLVLR